MDTGSIIPRVGDAGTGNLQRIQPTANSGGRERPRQRRRILKKAPARPAQGVYTPEGRFEEDEPGQVLDISA